VRHVVHFLVDRDTVGAGAGVLDRKCLLELDRITVSRFGESILPYVDMSRPTIVRWSRQPFARGCSKLYRASTDVDNLCMLSHNQDHGQRSGLYFAGEGYSVEGGWAEPAMRSALDALLWIVHAEGATLEPRLHLDFERDYPRWREHEHPSY
jgi:tryptophan 2-monooxygenase